MLQAPFCRPFARAKHERLQVRAGAFHECPKRRQKYVLALYATTDSERAKAKLEVAEDYDLDGKKEIVEYSNHWSWIFTLRNNPKTPDGVSVWQWAASKLQ